MLVRAEISQVWRSMLKRCLQNGLDDALQYWLSIQGKQSTLCCMVVGRASEITFHSGSLRQEKTTLLHDGVSCRIFCHIFYRAELSRLRSPCCSRHQPVTCCSRTSEVPLAVTIKKKHLCHLKMQRFYLTCFVR